MIADVNRHAAMPPQLASKQNEEQRVGQVQHVFDVCGQGGACDQRQGWAAFGVRAIEVVTKGRRGTRHTKDRSSIKKALRSACDSTTAIFVNGLPDAYLKREACNKGHLSPQKHCIGFLMVMQDTLRVPVNTLGTHISGVKPNCHVNHKRQQAQLQTRLTG